MKTADKNGEIQNESNELRREIQNDDGDSGQPSDFQTGGSDDYQYADYVYI